jgi:uncharacterized protein (TIGR03086 family)
MDVAAAELTARLRLLPPQRLETESSCSGWSVRELVNHVNGGGHRYLLLLRGAAAEELAATRSEDHVGSDPAGSFRRWQAPLAAEFAAQGALTRVVHHPVGDRSGADLLGMRVLDLTLHAWDLARSVGLEERLDPELCAHVLASHMHLVEELRAAGLYAAPRDGDPSDPQTELLLRTGRGERRLSGG